MSSIFSSSFSLLFLHLSFHQWKILKIFRLPNQGVGVEGNIFPSQTTYLFEMKISSPGPEKSNTRIYLRRLPAGEHFYWISTTQVLLSGCESREPHAGRLVGGQLDLQRDLATASGQGVLRLHGGGRCNDSRWQALHDGEGQACNEGTLCISSTTIFRFLRYISKSRGWENLRL